MYNTPSVIELKDIEDITNMAFDPDSNELLLTVKLKAGKTYAPEALYLADGFARMFHPTVNVMQWEEVPATGETLVSSNELTSLQQENAALTQHVNALEAELAALRNDLAAMPPVASEMPIAPSDTSVPSVATPETSAPSQSDTVAIQQAMNLPAKAKKSEANNE
jgi:hypothetical protein